MYLKGGACVPLRVVQGQLVQVACERGGVRCVCTCVCMGGACVLA